MTTRTPLLACLTLSIALLLAAPLSRADEPEASKLPKRLQPFEALVAQCAHYQALAAPVKWEPVREVTFDDGRKPEWKFNGDALPEGVKVVETDDRKVLDVPMLGERTFLALDATVKGDYRIEMVARAVSDTPCDLSLVMDGLGRGPAFQFGGYYNTRNLAWVGPVVEPGDADAYTMVDLPRNLLITRNTWHNVRLEVRNGTMYGYVDDKLVGSVRLTHSYEVDKERRPLIYCYSSAIQIDKVRVLQGKAEKGLDEAPRLKAAFGDVPLSRVNERLAQLTQLLDDDDWATREGAEHLLLRAGELAVPHVKAATSDGSAEVQTRAERILRMHLPPTGPSPDADEQGAAETNTRDDDQGEQEPGE